MNKFKIHSDFAPMGDQPEAIAQLSQGIADGVPAQTLLGVTGSGKTFTIANVIANAGKPTTRPWQHSCILNLRDSSQKMRLNITCRTTTITSQKPTSLQQIPI